MFRVKIKYLLIVLLMTILMPKGVWALTLDIDKNVLNVGDEIVVSANFPKDTSAYAFMATFTYDENVFEKIDDSNFELKNTSMDITYNASNKKFGIINQSGKITNELFKIVLKVKDNANVGNTNIALTNITSSDGNTKKYYPSLTKKVLITRDAKDGEEVPNNKENEVIEDQENIIKTFSNVPLIITLGVISLILLGIAIYVLIKHRDRKKTFVVFILLLLLSLASIITLAFVNVRKKDVNKDGVNDYNDAKDIIKYLIDIEGKEEDKNNESNTTNTGSNNHNSSNNYDVNNDGKVDINDAASSTENTTDKTKVSLTEYKEEKTYVKKGDITLRFKADITPKNVTVTQVKIGDKYYKVTLNEGIYALNIATGTKAGINEFTISEVLLSNGKTIKTKLTFKREVLKDVPTVNNFNLDDQKGSITFDLVDDDESFISGKAYIYEGNTVLAEVEVKASNTLNFETEEDKTYDIVIIGNYDLDSNKNDQNNNYKDVTMFSHSFTIGGDYNFKLNNISITDTIKKEEIPTISFTSSNIRKATITTANITLQDLTKDFDISKIDGNNYEIALNGADTSYGKHTVDLNSVGLSSLKTFKNNQDYKANTLTYTVLKDDPEVKELILNNDAEVKNVDVKFKLNDLDQTIKNLTVVLTDSTGKIVSRKDLLTEEFKDLENEEYISVSLPYAGNTDGRYTVSVLADYALADKYTYTKKSIGEKEIFTQNSDDIYISDIYVVNPQNNQRLPEGVYPTKGQKNYQIAVEVTVSDNIKASNGNAYTRLSGITVNGLNYVASQMSGYTSKIALTVPMEAGVLDVTVSRVQFEFAHYYNKIYDFYSVQEKTLQIDVLKDKPKIENLVIEKEDYDNKEVTFNFDVTLDKKALDSDFKGGFVELNGEKKDIQVGANKVTFTNVNPDTNYDLIFKGSYDLDTDTIATETDKNEYTDEEIYRVKYGLYNTDTYNHLNIVDGEVISARNDKYFEKNERIKLKFNLSGLDDALETSLAKVIIDDTLYKVTKVNEHYELVLDGYSSFGEKEIIVTGVILSNGKKVTLENPYSFKPEILKDVVSVLDFKYEDLGSSLKTSFALKDMDDSIVGQAKILITDQFGKVLYDDVYQNAVTFEKVANSLRYYVKIILDYDRDTDTTLNSANYINDYVLLEEVVSLAKNNIELKDITDITLYKNEIDGYTEKTTLMDEINVSELKAHKDDYFVEVKMANLPTVRANIENVLDADNKLVLVLKYDYVIKENTNKTQIVRVEFGNITDGVAKNAMHPSDAFKTLIQDLEAGKNVTLTHDYDASSITVDTDTYITSDYAGTLDGNGYTISNLNKALFNNITGGTIKNLKLKSINIVNASSSGTLANKASKATISNVIVDKVTKDNSGNASGGFIGQISDGTVIENSAVKNLDLKSYGYGNQQIGGFIGVSSGSTIKNSYVNGTVRADWNYVGAFIGNASNSNISNSYTKVAMSGSTTSYVSCGFVCSSGNNNSLIDNVILTTNAKNIFASGVATSLNNYVLTNQAADPLTGVTYIKNSDVNSELFNQANFSATIWNLKDISYENTPVFNGEKVSVLNDPNQEGYDETKELLYKNLQKLMPFYDSEKIINSALNVTNSLLATKEIKHIVPLDNKGNIVTYITTDNLKKIERVKIAFDSKETLDLKVLYDNTYDMVVSYFIPDLNVEYTFNHYVIDADSQIVINLTNYLESLTYTDNLDVLTTNADSRIYREFYDEVTKKELKEFVLKFLANSNYTNTSNDDKINNYLEREIKKDQKLEKVLYMYNYLRRFFDLDIEGLKIYDFMLFNMQGFDEELTPVRIADLYFGDGSGVNFNTNETNTRYSNVLGKYTNLNTIPKLLEYLVTLFGDGDLDKWVANEFKGILVEIPVAGHPEVQYTLWDHFSNEDERNKGNNYPVYNHVLPILTLPKNAAYIISSPVQYVIGSQRGYIKDTDNEAEQTILKKRIASYAKRIESYFDTAFKILNDEEIFNNIHTYHVDKRYTYDDNGMSVYNQPYTTHDPFHMNFNEVVNQWAHSDGNAAVAWGSRIDWSAEGLMDGNIDPDLVDSVGPIQEYTYHTFTHETAHNIDARLFLRDNGRRFDAGGEDYADSNLMQSFGPNDIVMNLSVNYKAGDKIGSNYTPERINTPAKVYDYYKKVFQTIYVMDYIEAQAFLQLDSSVMEEVAIQVSYPNESKYPIDTSGGYPRYRARQTSAFSQIKAADFAKMNLRTINDLVDNKLMIYPGVYLYASRGSNSYGGEGLGHVHWYQPNNPEGRPDSYAIKWFAYEMLGYKGYDEGYIEYYSNINSEKTTIYKNPDKPEEGTYEADFKTDTMALKKITGYSDFDTYKKDRFKEVEQNLKYLNKAINVKDYVQKFYDALVQDAAYSKEKVEALFKRDPNCLQGYWCTRELQGYRGVPNSTAVRQDIYYTLKNLTNDFEGEIYSKTVEQEIGDLTVVKNN